MPENTLVQDPVLDLAINYLRQEVAPKAQLIDRDPTALREALQGLCRLELMALKRPTEYGGPNISEEAFRTFQEEVARVSGSLAFLQTQHQSAGSMIAKGDNDALKNEYLPQMADGSKLVGIGFSQLRRPGEPIMKATPTEGGYLLNGNVPWVTGYSFYPEYLIGATLPDGRAIFGIVPLPTDGSVPGVSVSPPMQLAAMESPMTVAVDYQNVFLPNQKVVFIKSSDWIKNNDTINIALQGHFAIGCALAGLDILKANTEKRGAAFLQETYNLLLQEVERCRAKTREAHADVSEQTTSERLKLRAWQIDLAVRCAHAAVTSSSGAANSIHHPAQRVYREALVFTVSAQTTPIMEATLARLTR